MSSEHSLKVAGEYWEHMGDSNCDAAVNDLAALLDRELQAQHERTAEDCAKGLPETERYTYEDFDARAWLSARRWELQHPSEAGKTMGSLMAFLDSPDDPPTVSDAQLIEAIPIIARKTYREGSTDASVYARRIAAAPRPTGEPE